MHIFVKKTTWLLEGPCLNIRTYTKEHGHHQTETPRARLTISSSIYGEALCKMSRHAGADLADHTLLFGNITLKLGKANRGQERSRQIDWARLKAVGSKLSNNNWRTVEPDWKLWAASCQTTTEEPLSQIESCGQQAVKQQQKNRWARLKAVGSKLSNNKWRTVEPDWKLWAASCQTTTEEPLSQIERCGQQAVKQQLKNRWARLKDVGSKLSNNNWRTVEPDWKMWAASCQTTTEEPLSQIERCGQQAVKQQLKNRWARLKDVGSKLSNNNRRTVEPDWKMWAASCQTTTEEPLSQIERCGQQAVKQQLKNRWARLKDVGSKLSNNNRRTVEPDWKMWAASCQTTTEEPLSQIERCGQQAVKQQQKNRWARLKDVGSSQTTYLFTIHVNG